MIRKQYPVFLYPSLLSEIFTKSITIAKHNWKRTTISHDELVWQSWYLCSEWSISFEWRTLQPQACTESAFWSSNPSSGTATVLVLVESRETSKTWNIANPEGGTWLGQTRSEPKCLVHPIHFSFRALQYLLLGYHFILRGAPGTLVLKRHFGIRISNKLNQIVSCLLW